MDDSGISKLIQKKIYELKINNDNEIVKAVQSEENIPAEKILEIISMLKKSGATQLRHQYIAKKSFIIYLFSNQSLWFWLVLLSSILYLIVIIYINDVMNPLIFIRNIIGLIYSLFLPGYALIKTLFPRNAITTFERILFSIGASFAISPLLGYLLNILATIHFKFPLLNYLSEFRLYPLSVLIFIFITLFSIIGIYREYIFLKKE